MKKNTRARSAFWVISSPQVGPTDSKPVTSPRSASSVRNICAAAGSSMSERIRKVSPSTICTLESAASKSPRKSRASDTETPGAFTSKDVPPSKSIPRLNPRTANASKLISTRIAETANALRHNFGKSMLFWPRYMSVRVLTVLPQPRRRLSRPAQDVWGYR